MERNIDIKFTTQNGDIPVRIDSHLIQRVLDNLISNAIKYSPDNTSIEVMTLQEDNNVVVHITDQGFGIDPDHIKHIF